MSAGEREPSLREIIRDYQRTMQTFIDESRADRKKSDLRWAQFEDNASEDRKQAAEDRKQAAEDRRRWEIQWKQSEARAAEDRKLIIEVVHSLDRTQNGILALMARMIRLQEENNLLLRRLVSNGRFAGNGGGRTRRNRKPH